MNIPTPRMVLPLAALACALVLLLAALPPVPAQAQLDPAAAHALGSVSGRVTDEAGMPLPGIRVDFYSEVHPNRYYEPWYTDSLRTAITDADGRYAVRLEPRIYWVRFFDPSGFYAQQYYGNAVTVAAADDVVIMGNTRDDISAQLRLGGEITGMILGDDGPPEVSVVAYTKINAEWQIAQVVEPAGSPEYRLGGLPPGVYRVCAAGAWSLPTTPQPCYERKGSVPAATDVTVTAGQTVGGIDIDRDVDAIAEEATLRGTVRDASGRPLGGLDVEAFSMMNQGPYGLTTKTDANGVYTLPVPAPDTYDIEFRNPTGVYISQYYWTAGDDLRRTTVEVRPSTVRSGLDATLALGGRIRGAANIPDADDPNVSVAALAGEPLHAKYEGIYDPNTNTYVIGGIPPGVYRVCEIRWVGRPGMQVFDCYPNRVGFEEATPVTVTAGSTVSNIDLLAALRAASVSTLYLPLLGRNAAKVPPPTGGALSGTVQGEGSGALANIVVNLLTRDESGSWTKTNTVRTDAGGTYRFAGLPPGDYKLKFRNPDGIYQAQFYGSSNSGEGQVLSLSAGEQRNGLDVTLAPGGMISGVTLLDGVLPARGISIVASMISGFCPCYHEIYDAQTGAYVIGGVAPGIYEVQAVYDPPGAPRVDAYYGGARYDQITPVTITVGRRLQDIDIVLAKDGYDGVIAGIVTGDHGGPLGGIRVDLFVSGSNPPPPRLLYTTTNAQGEYRFDGLLDGSYALHFVDPSSVWSTGYLGVGSGDGFVQPIVVRDGVANLAADIQLQRGGFIRGRVSWRNGVPDSGATVRFFPAVGDLVTTANAAGVYLSGPLPPGSYTLCASSVHNRTAYACYQQGGDDGAPPASVTVTAGATTEGIDIVFGGTFLPAE